MSTTAVCYTLLAMLPIAYVIGGIPFGLLVGKARGIDVRNVGSGNIGATNVGRELGKRFFFLVLFLDAMKAFLPAMAASILVHATTTPAERTPLLYGLWVLVPIAAFLGHMFSIFLRFKGGKGVACGLGLVLGIWPYFTLPGLVGLAVFILVYKLSRFISLGSIAGSVTLPLAYLGCAWLLGWDVLGRQLPVFLLLSAAAFLIIVRHRSNIGRLWRGEELRNDKLGGKSGTGGLGRGSAAGASPTSAIPDSGDLQSNSAPAAE